MPNTPSLAILLGVPDGVMWGVIIITVILVVMVYMFPRQVDVTINKPFPVTTGVVFSIQRIAMLAVRLYVVQRGIDDNHKLLKFESIALLIDKLYLYTTKIRLSQLVYEIQVELNRQNVDKRLNDQTYMIKDIQHRIVQELAYIGTKVNDNEKDPLINPNDISNWIRLGISDIKKLK